MNNQTATSPKSLLSACERFFLANNLSKTSIKLYLADIKRFLCWLSASKAPNEALQSEVGLSALTNPSSYTRYFSYLHTSGTAPSTIARSQAALKQLGSF